MKAEVALPNQCKNCGEPLTMAFCPRCGQSADVGVPTIQSFLHDAASAVFTYDSKFWRTIKPLVFSPGKLSVEYVEGRRVPYVSPVPLYFWLQAICFFGFKLTYTTQFADAERRAKVLLICTLISAVVLAILHINKKRRFAESLVFSLHFNSFLLLLLTFVYPTVPFIVTKFIGLHWMHAIRDVGPITTFVAILIMLPYLIFALKRFYQEHWGLIILKVVAFYYIYFFFYDLLTKRFMVG